MKKTKNLKICSLNINFRCLNTFILLTSSIYYFFKFLSSFSDDTIKQAKIKVNIKASTKNITKNQPTIL